VTKQLQYTTIILKRRIPVDLKSEIKEFLAKKPEKVEVIRRVTVFSPPPFPNKLRSRSNHAEIIYYSDSVCCGREY